MKFNGLTLIGIAWLAYVPLCAAQPVTVDRNELRQLIREVLREEGAKPNNPTKAVSEPAPAAELDKRVERIEEKLTRADAVAAQGPTSLSAGPLELSFGGYGDIRFAHHDYSETALPPEGSRGASRTEFDLSRFTLEVEAEHRPLGLEFEAELELEHGGTGAAVELEQDEFGEFETEVEKGGEVVLEELFVRKDFGEGWSARAGRFYVAMGLLTPYHRPTDYLGATRSETEVTLLPAVWDEIGFEVQKELSFGRATLQLVNGLDSSGFGASRWVASGKQDKFETVRAEDIAVVGRLDYTDIPGTVIGASGYVGNTTKNRAKDDLDVDGTLFITDVHARHWGSRLRAQGAVIWGHLNDANEISERNGRLSNELGFERTAVAEEAGGIWAEVGYDIAPELGLDRIHRIDPYLRFDYYDTYFSTQDALADNKRYERRTYTAGLAYTLDNFIVTKLDYGMRDYAQTGLSTQNTLTLEIGFVY